MAKLFVYDVYANKFLIYTDMNESDPMPYSYGKTLTLGEFRGSSNAAVLWTTTAAMEAWNLTRRSYGAGIPVGYAFKRIWEGGHGTTSQHYAGVALTWGRPPPVPTAKKSTPPPPLPGPGGMWSPCP